MGYAMFGGRSISYRTEDISKMESVQWYMNWLAVDHATRRGALEEAVNRKFAIRDDDEFVSQTLRGCRQNNQMVVDCWECGSVAGGEYDSSAPAP